MTVETAVLLGLIAIWVLPPVLIFVVMRFDSVRGGFEFGLNLPFAGVRQLARVTRQKVLEPIQLSLDEDAKARRQEMAERDKVRIEISLLQYELDFAEIKANEYQLRINDPHRSGSRKNLAKKKTNRNTKKRKHKGKNDRSSLANQDSAESEPRSVEPLSGEELQNALANEQQKMQDLKLRLSELQAKIDEFDTAATLREAQASLRMYEDVLSKMGCAEDFTAIDSMEIAINEKVEKLRALAQARQEAEVVFQPPPVMNPERFRLLVEQEKEKILEKQAKLPTRKELDEIENLGSKINRSFNRVFNVHKRINEFLARLDPDVERVFERMRAHFVQATEAHQISKQQEIDLRASLTDTSERVLRVSQKIAGANPGTVMTLTSTRTTLEASAIDLEATLNSLCRKNKANENRLFEVALVIQRLAIIKSMLTILPVSLADTIESLNQIVNAGCALLADESLGRGVIDHIDERLGKLEHNAMMACIRIAKGERKLKGREFTQLLQRLSMAAASLTLERQELMAHKERWERELSALDEGEQELRSTASYRRDCYSHIVATIDRSLEVVSALSLHSKPSARSQA